VPLIPFVFLLLPLAEIATFVAVGSRIGVLATIGLVVASGVLGMLLLRIQGFGALQRIRAMTETGGSPGREMVHGAMIVMAAILLILPGFLTDVAGLLLFIPPVREIAWRFLRGRITVSASTGGFTRTYRDDRVIDLDRDDYSRRPPSDDKNRTIED